MRCEKSGWTFQRGNLGWWALLLATVGVGMVSGCSRQDGSVTTYPVRGMLLFQGEPAVGAFVVFHPSVSAEGVERPSAHVGPDGSFVATTFQDGDGAPAGEYAVTVEWWKLLQAGGEAVPGPNVIPAPYARPDSSPLKVTIAEGENTLPAFRID